MNYLDWLTLISYVAINTDVLLQIRRIYRTKSSEDLSLVGMAVRYAAIVTILFKFLSLDSKSLIIGQCFIIFTFTIYFVMAFAYFLSRKKPVSKRAKRTRTQKWGLETLR